MLRLSSAEAGGIGAEAASLLPDVCLESHENGPVNFRDGGVGAGIDCFEAGGPEGGGPHGIEGKAPESPCERKGSFGGGSAGCAVSSVEVVSIERDLDELSLLLPLRCTSSRDVIEIRCAVSKGDFRGSSGGTSSGCGSITFISSVWFPVGIGGSGSDI